MLCARVHLSNLPCELPDADERDLQHKEANP